MKRLSLLTILLLVAATLLRADVKTTEKVVTKFGGVLGTMSRFMGPAASDEGITSSVALKGDRKLSLNDLNGEIVDLAAEKVYRLDLKKKEYRVLTFDQVRKEWLDTKAEAEKNARQLQEMQRDNPDAPPGTLEFSATVKETGQNKTVAGQQAREVVVTITGVQPGKTLEEGGGMVLTNTLWLGPSIAAVDDIRAFDMRYFKAIMGDENADVLQQMTILFAMFGNMKPAMDQMIAEGRKLQGTQLASVFVMETVKSAEQMKAGAGSQSSGGVSGIGGMLARRLPGGRGASADNGPRQTTFRTTREILTLALTATAEDVAVPAGLKEKK